MLSVSSPIRRCVRVVRLELALLSVPVTLAAASPAYANYYAPIMRLGGEWQTPFGKLVLKADSFEGVLTGAIVDPTTGKMLYGFWWDLHPFRRR